MLKEEVLEGDEEDGEEEESIEVVLLAAEEEEKEKEVGFESFIPNSSKRRSMHREEGAQRRISAASAKSSFKLSKRVERRIKCRDR